MRAKAAIVAVIAGAVGYAGLQRLGRTFGATAEDQRRNLPGDELIASPMAVTTHATTIAAPPERIWPWLLQMGWHRGGWYTAEWVDRLLFPANWPSATTIVPALQHLKVGDVVPDGPPQSGCAFVVTRLEPERHLVLRSTTHLPPGWAERFTRGSTGRGRSCSTSMAMQDLVHQVAAGRGATGGRRSTSSSSAPADFVMGVAVDAPGPPVRAAASMPPSTPSTPTVPEPSRRTMRLLAGQSLASIAPRTAETQLGDPIAGHSVRQALRWLQIAAAPDPDDQTAIHHVGLNELQEVVVDPHLQAGWRVRTDDQASFALQLDPIERRG